MVLGVLEGPFKRGLFLFVILTPPWFPLVYIAMYNKVAFANILMKIPFIPPLKLISVKYYSAGIEAEDQDEPADGAPVAQPDGDRHHPAVLLHRHQRDLPHGGGQQAQGHVRHKNNLKK